MAIIYDIQERRVIPNWRDFKRTLQLGELGTSHKGYSPVKLNIDRTVFDWKLEQNIGTAADLINASFIAGVNNVPEIDEAIKLIRSNESKTSSSLLELIEKVRTGNSIVSELSNTLLEIDYDTVEEFQALVNNQALHKIIHRTKNRARIELYNPIVWVELARLYSMRGHIEKAENAILTSLALAPNNRFVLRSATRFFIHHEKFDKALFYLRRSKTIKSDPWLISAHIATSSVVGKFSPFIKDGKQLLSAHNFSDFDITELSSSIGTLEFKDGSFKKAKEYFKQSMLAPNDNSLAQLEWISKDDLRFQFNPFMFSQVINPFEARALDLFSHGKWKEAFENSIKWFLDMPFSKRPAMLGSYIAGSLLGDKNAAIILCEVGLQANPLDPTLLNNIVYSIATSNNHENLDKYVRQLASIDRNSLSNEKRVTYQATLGLVALKQGETELGIGLYKAAIANATKLKNEYLKNLAIVNFTREIALLGLPEKNEMIEIVRQMKVQENQSDVRLIREEILNKYSSIEQG